MKTLNMLKVKRILLLSFLILWASICQSQVTYFGAALLNSQKLSVFKIQQPYLHYSMAIMPNWKNLIRRLRKHGP